MCTHDAYSDFTVLAFLLLFRYGSITNKDVRDYEKDILIIEFKTHVSRSYVIFEFFVSYI